MQQTPNIANTEMNVSITPQFIVLIVQITHLVDVKAENIEKIYKKLLNVKTSFYEINKNAKKNVLHRWNKSHRLLLVQLSQIPAYRPISISTLYTANQWRNVTAQ